VPWSHAGNVVQGGITRAGCWAHARRKFVDAEASRPEVAREAVELIGQLYGVEEEARDLHAGKRLIRFTLPIRA